MFQEYCFYKKPDLATLILYNKNNFSIVEKEHLKKLWLKEKTPHNWKKNQNQTTPLFQAVATGEDVVSMTFLFGIFESKKKKKWHMANKKRF